MKHILNNLTEEEKNSIREQHTGGMKVMTENFSKLLNSKLGDSKPLVNEQIIPQNYLTLMKKVVLKYKPMGLQGLSKNTKKDNDVLTIQKYLNKSGMLGPGKKYPFLQEDGILGSNTYSQINNIIGATDKEFWNQNKFEFK
jgi:hypothetical protein